MKTPAAFAGAPRALDAQHVELVLNITEYEIVAGQQRLGEYATA
jgi:hypothetical protein